MTDEIVVGLDVDSTVMAHSYPGVGEDIGAIPWLLRAKALSPKVRFMLCTMRSGAEAEEAKVWLEERGVPIWAVNEHPSQSQWTTSPKPYYHVLADDRAVGAPLNERGEIDWAKFGPMFLSAIENTIKFGVSWPPRE